MTARVDALLCSINDRLGALAHQFCDTAGGADFLPLGDAYLADLLMIEQEAREEAEEPEDAPDGEPGWVKTLEAMQGYQGDEDEE